VPFREDFVIVDYRNRSSQTVFLLFILMAIKLPTSKSKTTPYFHKISKIANWCYLEVFLKLWVYLVI